MPKTTTEAVIDAAGAPTNFAAMAIILAHAYERLNSTKKYTQLELNKHRKLTALYLQYVGNELPKEWELIDEAPKYGFKLDNLMDQYKNHILNLKMTPAHIKQSARGMLDTIVKLLNSVSKRTTGAVRSDSVECMFFTQLAVWIYTELPQEKFEEKETISRLKKIDTYCEAVGNQVLEPESSAKNAMRNNFLPVLTSIRENLQQIIQETEALVESVTFDYYIKALNNHALHMAAQAFHILYLLIDGDHEKETQLPVDVFVNPNQNHRPKILAIHQKRSAVWILKSLEKLGIVDNSFKNKRITSLADAEMHLSGEYCGDDNCTLQGPLIKSPSAKEWGDWSFFTSAKLNDELDNYLKDKRDVHRHILKIYRLGSLLAKIIQISPVYGEVWLYGDDTGQLMVNVLLSRAFEITNDLHEAMKKIWTNIHGVFESKRMKAEIKANDPAYEALTAANAQFSEFKTAFEGAKTKVGEVKAHFKTFQNRRQRAEKSKIELLNSLAEDLQYLGKTDSDEYKALVAAGTKMSQQTILEQPRCYTNTALPAGQENSLLQSFFLKEENLPRYLKIKALLTKSDAPIFGKMTLQSCSIFKSSTQESIYRKFLAPYLFRANHPRLFALVSWYTTTKKFAQLYHLVLQVFNEIHRSSTGDEPDISSFEVMLANILIIQRIKLSFERHNFFSFDPIRWEESFCPIVSTERDGYLRIQLPNAMSNFITEGFVGAIAEQVRVLKLAEENAKRVTQEKEHFEQLAETAKKSQKEAEDKVEAAKKSQKEAEDKVEAVKKSQKEAEDKVEAAKKSQKEAEDKAEAAKKSQKEAEDKAEAAKKSQKEAEDKAEAAIKKATAEETKFEIATQLIAEQKRGIEQQAEKIVESSKEYQALLLRYKGVEDALKAERERASMNLLLLKEIDQNESSTPRPR